MGVPTAYVTERVCYRELCLCYNVARIDDVPDDLTNVSAVVIPLMNSRHVFFADVSSNHLRNYSFLLHKEWLYNQNTLNLSLLNIL